ncbi:MAG TPA: hypothetical protein VEW68_06370, partial [Patescibacteria group bacterium]|nr:hypothetical protein [Patescibacteria group bacterium]
MPWLFLLAAWVIAFVAVGAGYAAWNRAGLRLSLKVVGDVGNRSSIEELPELVWRSAPAPVPPFEGDPLEVEVGLVTTGRPRGPASVTGTLGAERIELATEIVPAIGWRARHTIAASRRGPVDATSWTVGSSDPLGFFR